MIVSLKVADNSIYDEVGTMGNAVSQKVLVRNTITDAYFRIAVTGETDYAGRTNPADGTSSWKQATHIRVATC